MRQYLYIFFFTLRTWQKCIHVDQKNIEVAEYNNTCEKYSVYIHGMNTVKS